MRIKKAPCFIHAGPCSNKLAMLQQKLLTSSTRLRHHATVIMLVSLIHCSTWDLIRCS